MPALVVLPKFMRKGIVTLALASLTMNAAAEQLPLKLWYNKTSTAFEESLPIGNGKLGALIYGGFNNDSIYVNDLTFWTGKPVDPNEGGDAYKWIPEIRKALFNEDYKRADSLQLRVQGHNSTYYQSLGRLNIKDLNEGSVSNYYRELSLDSAIAKLSYTRNGITFKREYLASNPDKVIPIKLTASKEKSLNYNISLTSIVPHKVNSSKGQLTMTGHAIGDENNSTHFCTIVSVKSKDGEISYSDSTLHLLGATEATLYLVNETSYNGFDKHPVTEGAPYIENATDEAWHLANYTFDAVKEKHIKDYKNIFDRFSFNLKGATYDKVRTTEEQLMDYSDKQEANPYLEMLYFQYGRYLLISCSRTPNLPANLQGLWAPQKYSPWRGNYTININLEENYWPAEVTNMPELVKPVDELVKAMSITGKETAKHYYGITEGWCSGHNTDAWAMTNPVGNKKESPKWSDWNMGGAWLVQTLWDHYDYTRDLAYLKETAYPLMKGAADFMLNWLVENPKKPGELITAPCTSPEAEFITDKGYQGCTFYGGTSDLAIIRELFKNTIKAAQALNIDKDYQLRLNTALSKLHPYKIGKRGNLQEWYYDWEDQDWHHRHQSHLLGLHPFSQISIDKTPELAAAASKTLEIKGDNTTGWSAGWRVSIWARLQRADKSYQMLRKLLTYVKPANYNDPKHRPHGGTYPNLFDAHPPFQIDGNFGGTAGICEMIMQCDGETMSLLPALPTCWQDGEMKGLKARGNYAIDLTWEKGKVKKANITSKFGGCLTIKYNNKVKKLVFKLGQTRKI